MNYLREPVTDSNSFLCIPGHRDYVISLAGQVRNVRTGRILLNFVQQSNTRYYAHCHLGRVHRLLMSAILGRPLARHELVLHRDGNTFNNAPNNLRIGSALQNAFDRISTNTNGNKLRNQHVRDIRALASKLPRRELARRFGVTTTSIGCILRGQTWRNLP